MNIVKDQHGKLWNKETWETQEHEDALVHAKIQSDNFPKGGVFNEWIAYDQANPHVIRILIEILREGRRRGIDHWSIQGAFEVCRWERKFEVFGLTEFKIGNQYGAYYSRVIMMCQPDLYGFMDTARSRADQETGWQDFKAIKKEWAKAKVKHESA